MRELVRVENLCKDFGGDRAVDRVNFSLREGEVLGLLGPNGAGKTTIIRCVMGIIQPDSGRIRFFPDQDGGLRGTGYLPEERGLFKDMPVMDIFLYLAKLRRYPAFKARERALYYLEKFGLAGQERRKVQELSKGMAQKVQFICAILHEPKLLILDEPFSGLDPVSQNIFLEEVRVLSRQGTAILLSAHQMNLVEEVCDRIFFIHKGKRVLHGDLQDIKEQFADFKIEIVGDIEDVSFETVKSAKRIEKDKGRVTIFMGKNPFRAEFLQELPGGIRIREMHVGRISLHDIFVEVTTGGGSNGR